MEALWNQYHDEHAAEKFADDADFWARGEAGGNQSVTRKVLNYMKDKLPNLIGGSTDLAPSNKTNMSGEGDFSKATPEGRNLHFGVPAS